MLILMKTYSSSEHDNDDYDLALADIRESDAKILATLLNCFKAAKENCPEFIYGHYKAVVPCTFFSEDDLDANDPGLDDVLDDVENIGWSVIPKDVDLPVEMESAHEPELLHLLMTSEGFAWRAFPEGSDLSIDTESVPASVLSQLI